MKNKISEVKVLLILATSVVVLATAGFLYDHFSSKRPPLSLAEKVCVTGQAYKGCMGQVQGYMPRREVYVLQALCPVGRSILKTQAPVTRSNLAKINSHECSSNKLKGK